MYNEENITYSPMRGLHPYADSSAAVKGLAAVEEFEAEDDATRAVYDEAHERYIQSRRAYPSDLDLIIETKKKCAAAEAAHASAHDAWMTARQEHRVRAGTHFYLPEFRSVLRTNGPLQFGHWFSREPWAHLHTGVVLRDEALREWRTAISYGDAPSDTLDGLPGAHQTE